MFSQAIQEIRENTYWNFNVPDDYELQFFKAFLAFRFYKVYCPISKSITTLNPLDLELWDTLYAKVDKQGQESLTKDEREYKKFIEDNIMEADLMDILLFLHRNNQLDLSFLGLKGKYDVQSSSSTNIYECLYTA